MRVRKSKFAIMFLQHAVSDVGGVLKPVEIVFCHIQRLAPVKSSLPSIEFYMSYQCFLPHSVFDHSYMHPLTLLSVSNYVLQQFHCAFSFHRDTSNPFQH